MSGQILTKKAATTFSKIQEGGKGIFRCLPQNIVETLTKNTAEKTKKILKSIDIEQGNSYIVALGGGTLEREIIFWLPTSTEITQKIQIECFDLLSQEPVSIEEERKKGLNIAYHTAYDIADWADAKKIPQELIQKTELLTMHGVIEYLQQETAKELLINIRDEIQPRYRSIRFPYLFCSTEELKKRGVIALLEGKKQQYCRDDVFFRKGLLPRVNLRASDLKNLGVEGVKYPATYANVDLLRGFMKNGGYDLVAVDGYTDETYARSGVDTPNTLVTIFEKNK